MTDLLPCPFCGGSANFWKGEFGSLELGAVCSNKDCGVFISPSNVDTANWPDDDKEWKKQEIKCVVDAWNTRPQGWTAIDEFQTIHYEWAKSTFPDETIDEVLSHLKAEIKEFFDDPKDIVEVADCFMLFLYACKRHDLTLSQLAKRFPLANILEAMKEKHQTNLKRLWGGKDENGIYTHLIDPPKGEK